MHFLPAMDIGFRKKLITRLGENPYKGIFSLLMVLAIYLVISGWKAASPELVYLPAAWGRHATALLTLLGLILFVAPYTANNFRRLLRHPQLTGLACWGVGHLLSNGETRSIILFGGLAVWAIIEIVLLNRRDGSWTKPNPAPRKNDILLIIYGSMAYALVLFAHQWMFGVSPFS
jgi:uncharacterized membrane protein